MGKGVKTKKKNPGVGIDFKRAKHKVGKKLARAQNETDVNFRSRSINLPGQSVTEDREGIAVSSRQLTLKELLAQCGHYSEKVRKDGLAGLSELLGKHPAELRRHAGPLMERLAERITDNTTDVRKELRDLLAGVVLPGLGPSALQPFLPLLMAHTCSAMTHLAQDVRSTALGFLDAIMSVAPEQVAAAYMGPALQHFADLLSQGGRGASLTSRSLPSLLKVVTGLEGFLSKAAASRAPKAVLPAAQAPGAQQSMLDVERALHWRRCQWPGQEPAVAYAAALAAASSGTILGLHRGSAAASKAEAKRKDGALEAARSVFARLLECWAECGPAQLASAPELQAAQCLAAIATSANLLLQMQPALADGALENAVLKYVAPHFPAPAPALKPSPPLLAALTTFNLQSARLLARFLPPAPPQQHFPSPVAAVEASVELSWVTRLLDFYQSVLEHGRVLPVRGSLTHDRSPSVLSAEAFEAALAGVEQALPVAAPLRRTALMTAVTALLSRSPSKSAVRAACVRFQLRLLQQYTTRATPTVAHISGEEAAVWIQAVPKLLWELGASRPSTSEAALHLLLDAGRTAPAGSALGAALLQLQPQLAPLLCTLMPRPQKLVSVIPAKGKGKKGIVTPQAEATAKLVVGPMAQLPTGLQVLAVDIIYFHPSISEVTLRTAALLCLTGAYPPQLGVRAVDILSRRVTAGSVDLGAFSSFLAALLLGHMAGVPADASWQRHVSIVGAAVNALILMGSPGVALKPLEAPLLEALSSAPTRRASYGVLRVTGALLQAGGSALAETVPQLYSALPGLMAEYAVGPSQQPRDLAPSSALASPQMGEGALAPAVQGGKDFGGVTEGEAVVLSAVGQDPVGDLLRSDAKLMPGYLAALEVLVGAGDSAVVRGGVSSSMSRSERAGAVAVAFQRVLEDEALRVAVLDAQIEVGSLLSGVAAAVKGDASAAGVECARLCSQQLSEASNIYGQGM